MAENKRAVGSVTYRDAEQGYFERRKLRRHAAFWSLWALGVGAVISGDFYGWNLGLDAGGFGGLLIAGIVITIMYYGLCFSIAEMSPALPHTGGAYSFSRSAMGPWGGFITGLAENMEYVITPAVVVGAMGFLSHDIVFDLTGADGWWNSPVLWWAIYYIIFVGINILGIEITMRFTVVITVLALGILAFFFVAVIFTGSFDASLLTNIPPEEGGSSFLPKGIAGIFPALPFAIWFYLAIEELPLAAEESHDPKRDIPRATIWGLTTLVLFAVLHPVPEHRRRRRRRDHRNLGDPVVRRVQGGLRRGHGGLRARADRADRADRQLLHDHLRLRPQHVLAVPRGLLPAESCRSPTRPGTRRTSRSSPARWSGTSSRWSSTSSGRARALLAGQIVGALLYMAVFGAVISYFMQCLAFIMLRRKLPNIERPYRSPVGVWGAAVAGAIALVALVSLFFNADYRPGVVGTLIYFLIGLLYFAVAGRHKLVLSPEEEFALSQGQHGANLQEEGYGTVSVTEIATDDSPTRSRGGRCILPARTDT